MTNQTISRLWDAGSLLLNPVRLIDWLLDQLDEVSPALVPVRTDIRSSCSEHHDWRRAD